MNEEEKEAIECLELVIDTESDIETEDLTNKCINTILNLIDKQQIEIKARIEEIESLYKMMLVKDDEIEKLDYELTYSWVHNQGISKETLKLFKGIIEKQQKEIENLKENNKKLQDKGKELIFEKQELTSALLDSIPKDKIKEKIEELKNRKIGASTGIFAVQVDILEELLGE